VVEHTVHHTRVQGSSPTRAKVEIMPKKFQIGEIIKKPFFHHFSGVNRETSYGNLEISLKTGCLS
jgi:hypothetical protein